MVSFPSLLPGAPTVRPGVGLYPGGGSAGGTSARDPSRGWSPSCRAVRRSGSSLQSGFHRLRRGMVSILYEDNVKMFAEGPMSDASHMAYAVVMTLGRDVPERPRGPHCPGRRFARSTRGVRSQDGMRQRAPPWLHRGEVCQAGIVHRARSLLLRLDGPRCLRPSRRGPVRGLETRHASL